MFPLMFSAALASWPAVFAFSAQLGREIVEFVPSGIPPGSVESAPASLAQEPQYKHAPHFAQVQLGEIAWQAAL